MTLMKLPGDDLTGKLMAFLESAGFRQQLERELSLDARPGLVPTVKVEGLGMDGDDVVFRLTVDGKSDELEFPRPRERSDAVQIGRKLITRAKELADESLDDFVERAFREVPE